MADDNRPIGQDVSGTDILKEAAETLLNAYPGLSDTIPFEDLTEYGMTFSADNGALVLTERRSITDYVRQECQFPFFVVVRMSANTAKDKAYTFLDGLGKWLCMEPTAYDPPEYPALSENRKITRVTRQNPYGAQPNQDGTQDWLLPVTINYTNEFQLW